METTMARQSKKRKIKAEEFHLIQDMFHQLNAVLQDIGIVELKISKQEQSIYWDTEGGAKINPHALEQFCDLIENHYMERLFETTL
jgi:hypothetical protein